MLHDTKYGVDEWRLVVLRGDASEVLAEEYGSALRLPRFLAPRGTRVARELGARLLHAWGLTAFALRPLPRTRGSDERPTSRVHLFEAVEERTETLPGARWIPVSTLAQTSLEAVDVEAVWQFRISSPSEDPQNPIVLGRPGTYSSIRRWLQEALHGRSLRNGFLQLNASHGFSLVRFQTNRGPIWFKAVGEPNCREFPLTTLLSQALPQHLPQLLAENPCWNAWVTTEVEGESLTQCRDQRAWHQAGRDLAVMQMDSTSLTQHVLACGGRDTRVETLLSKIAPFFACVRLLMERQTKLTPEPLSVRELDHLEARMRSALVELGDDGVPDCLGHLDLNPDNVIASNDHTVFLDWAEASVGHPYFSLAYLAEHFRRMFPAMETAPSSLVDAYTRVWSSFHSHRDLSRSLALAGFVAVFAHAVSTEAWLYQDRLNDPFLAGYYRSLARRMAVDAERLASGRWSPALCV